MKTAFFICGALAREVQGIIRKHGWDATLFGVSAVDHLFPERIGPDVENRYLSIRKEFDRVIIVYGDCGSRGALDALIAQYDLTRVKGPHCYEMYGGSKFQTLMDEEPGTFFLTDFLVRGFRGTILRGLGLDRFPQLKEEYFRNYKRIVYLTQNETEDLVEQAQAAADYLGLPLEIRYTGYGLLEERLVALMSSDHNSKTSNLAP